MKRETVIAIGIGILIALPYVIFSSPRLNFPENMALRLSGIPLAAVAWWLFFRKKPPQP